MKLLAIPILAVLFAACGGGGDGQPLTQQTLDTGATQQAITVSCQAEWDAFVAEWNALVTAGGGTPVQDPATGTIYETYADFARARDYPITFAEHCG